MNREGFGHDGGGEGSRHPAWLEEYDIHCDRLVQLATQKRDLVVKVAFYDTCAALWRLLDEAPEGLFVDCHDTVNLLIGDFLREAA